MLTTVLHEAWVVGLEVMKRAFQPPLSAVSCKHPFPKRLPESSFIGSPHLTLGPEDYSDTEPQVMVRIPLDPKPYSAQNPKQESGS